MRSPKAVRRPKRSRAILSRINAQGKRLAAYRNSVRNWINSTTTTDPRYAASKAAIVYHDLNQIEEEIARRNVQAVNSENDDKRRIELAQKEQEKEKKRREKEVKRQEEQKRKEEERKKRAAEEAKREAEEQRKREEAEAREAEERRKKEEEKAKKLAEEKAKKEAEQKAKKEAEEKAKKEAGEKAKREVEEKAKKEAEEKAKKEAEKAQKEAEKKAKKEAEKAQKEAEKKAKEEAERKAKEEAEEKAKREAEEKAKKEAEKANVEEVIEKTEVHSQQSAKQNGHQENHQSKQSKKQQKKNKRNANSTSEDQSAEQNGGGLTQELILDMSTVGSGHDALTKCSVDSGVDVTDFQTGKKGKKGNKSTSDVSLSSNKSSSDESVSGETNAKSPNGSTPTQVLGEQLIEKVVLNGASALPLDKEGTPTRFAQSVAEFVTHAHQIIQQKAESQPLKHIKIEPIVPLVLPPKIERPRPRERVYKLLPQDIEYCSYMMETYGEDYETMVKDKKNVYMDSPTHLKRKIRIFRDSPQYELYLKAKAEGKPISSIC